MHSFRVDVLCWFDSSSAAELQAATAVMWASLRSCVVQLACSASIAGPPGQLAPHTTAGIVYHNPARIQ
jgi:hypothetical protein